MATNIGPKIGVDGEKEFRAELRNINTTLKTLDTEMKKVTSEFRENGESQEALTKKNETLNKSIEAQEKKLEMVKKALSDSSEKFGETSAKTMEWQQVLNRTETALNDLKNELSKNEKALGEMEEGLRDTETGLKNVDKAAENVDDIGKKFKDVAKDGVKALSTALVGLATAFLATAETSREYRTDQAKLTSAFKTAGYSAETAKEAFLEIYSLMGEDDTAVEAANHLAELTRNEEDLAKWTGTILPGVFAKFGDSLPLEGLTEAANETAKVGQVTGPLADALNWAGISEDKFNESLAKCSSEQERQTLITETLTKTYSNISKEFKSTNEDVLEANKAQARLTDSIAKLGAIAEPIMTDLKNLLADVIDVVAEAAKKFSDLPEGVRKAVLAFLGITAAAGPAITIIGKVKDVIKSVSGASSALGSSSKGLFSILSSNPYALVTGLVIGLGAAIWKLVETTNEEIKAAKKMSAEHEEEIDDIKSQSSLAELYAKKLDELSKVENKTAEQKKLMQTYVDKLNESTEGLNLTYDAEADALNQTTEAIHEKIEAREQEALAEAYLKQSQEALEEYAEAEMNIIDLENKRQAAKDEINRLTAKGTELTWQERIELEKAKKTVMECNVELEELNKSQVIYSEEAQKASNAAQMQTGAFDALLTEAGKLKEDLPAGLVEALNAGKTAIPQTVDELNGLINFQNAVNNAGQSGEDIVDTLYYTISSGKLDVETAIAIINSGAEGELDKLPGIVGEALREAKEEGYKTKFEPVGEAAGNAIAKGFQNASNLINSAVLGVLGAAMGKGRSYASGSTQSGKSGRMAAAPMSAMIEGGEDEEIQAPMMMRAVPSPVTNIGEAIRSANEAMTYAAMSIGRPGSGLNISIKEAVGRINNVPTSNERQQIINLTTYSVLDGKIISKTVQKDITGSQMAQMRMKGVNSY